MNEKFSPNYYIVRFTEYEMVDTVKGYTSKREASIHILISFPVLCGTDSKVGLNPRLTANEILILM